MNFISRRLKLFAILLMVTHLPVMAEVKLPAIFSNNMVLQRNAEVALWGWGRPGAKITIKSSWSKRTVTTLAASNGKWRIALQTADNGGTHSLTVSDGKPVTISNILLGDVWLCSGQSNMTMPLKGFPNDPVRGSLEEITSTKSLPIRVFDVARSSKLVPQDSLKGVWKEVSPENLATFSATAWFFGKTLQQQLNIPIGLITSSWGGSNIETWMSSETLSNFPDIRLPKVGDTLKLPNQTPTILFNNMIYPILGYGLKGMIWYQGESNREKPQAYVQLLSAMVSDWRKRWGMGDFPFFLLQIAPFQYGKGLSSAYIREAQVKSQQVIPNSGIGILLDAGEEKNIHPSNKKVAGQRLAYLALVKTYGLRGFSATGPLFKAMKVTNGTAQITFDYAESGLTAWGKELEHFEIAGADQKFYKASATINKYGVAVSNPTQVPQPVAVRYAFKDFVVGELFNNEGLPASSFRTDNWPPTN